jgi:hypothetical protein
VVDRSVLDTSSSERLRVALELCDLGIEVMRQNLKRREPAATDARIAEGLETWLRERPSLATEAAGFRLVTWPRSR